MVTKKTLLYQDWKHLQWMAVYSWRSEENTPLWIRFGGFIEGVPVSVVKPHWISNYCISILIAVPAIVGVRPILNIKNSMTKAGFSISWIMWLRFCHAAQRRTHKNFAHDQKSMWCVWTVGFPWKCTFSITWLDFHGNVPFLLLGYVVHFLLEKKVGFKRIISSLSVRQDKRGGSEGAGNVIARKMGINVLFVSLRYISM